jgi:hypothetical protein
MFEHLLDASLFCAELSPMCIRGTLTCISVTRSHKTGHTKPHTKPVAQNHTKPVTQKIAFYIWHPNLQSHHLLHQPTAIAAATAAATIAAAPIAAAPTRFFQKSLSPSSEYVW